MRGRPKAGLVLTEDEHEQLTALTLRRKTAQALALRARIVLVCAEGVDNKSSLSFSNTAVARVDGVIESCILRSMELIMLAL